MIKRNLIAFGLHLVIVSIGLLVTSINIVAQNILFAFSVIIYFVLGRCFLDTGNLFKNLMSFSSIWLVGIIIWVFDFKIYNFHEYRNVELLKGVIYSFYYSSVSPILELCYVPINEKFSGLHPLRAFWVSFIPTTVMWLGLQWKSMCKKS
ncbi:hypothetical protein [Sporosalibacterium faouarense]|uniref:hypothetical protein n=1 Tax=Sporosalibacterium faouarense TaxID=516123 RepID=UPI00141D6195|nr:hypothetical protein [Sporosalibacterium faouarense]MTI47874.1 hypothetical protein [Bacillota bacterium]